MNITDEIKAIKKQVIFAYRTVNLERSLDYEDRDAVCNALDEALYKLNALELAQQEEVEEVYA